MRERAWVVVIDGAVEVETGDGSMRADSGTLLEFEPTERRTVRSEDGAPADGVRAVARPGPLPPGLTQRRL